MLNKEEDTFKKLSSRKIKSLSMEEKIEYYKNLREDYLNSNFDEEKSKKDEKQFLLAAKFIITAFDLMYNPKVVNPEMIPEKEDIGTIFVANHLGSLDQFPIISALGKDRPLHTMISSTLLNLARGYLYKNVGCIVVDLKDLKSQLAGMQEAANIILRGGDVLIFAEGTRNTTEKFMLDFSRGPVTVAQETGAKIVPVTVNEDYKLGKNNLYVRFGEQITIGIDDDLIVSNDKLRDAVATLVWYNMELEKKNRQEILREEIIENYYQKKLKLEKQRQKINNKKTK